MAAEASIDLYLKIVQEETDYEHDGYCSGPSDRRIKVNSWDTENPRMVTKWIKLSNPKYFLTFCGDYINRDMSVERIPPVTDSQFDWPNEARKRYGHLFKDVHSHCCGTDTRFISAELVRDTRSELYEDIFGESFDDFHREGLCKQIKAGILEAEAEKRAKEEAEEKARKEKIIAERQAEVERRKAAEKRRREMAKVHQANSEKRRAEKDAFKMKNRASTSCPHLKRYGKCGFAERGCCWYKHE